MSRSRVPCRPHAVARSRAACGVRSATVRTTDTRLRWATADDIERIADMNARVFRGREDDPPNPWDRAISAYYWEYRSRKRLPDFQRFLRRMRRHGLLSNFDTYAIDGRIAVDRVFLYEDLQAGLDELTRRLGLPGPLELPDAKREYRKDRRPYQEFYPGPARDFVAEACACRSPSASAGTRVFDR